MLRYIMLLCVAAHIDQILDVPILMYAYKQIYKSIFYMHGVIKCMLYSLKYQNTGQKISSSFTVTHRSQT